MSILRQLVEEASRPADMRDPDVVVLACRRETWRAAKAAAAADPVELLAFALVECGLVAALRNYAREAHPDTMRDETLDEIAQGWAKRLAARLP